MAEFVSVRAGCWQLRLRRELAGAAFAQLCSVPADQLPEGYVPVVSSANTEVRRFSHLGQDYFLKEYFFLGWKKHVKVLGRCEHLVAIADRLAKQGFFTPRIVGIGRCGRNRRVITEAIADARDVWQVLYPDFKHHRGGVDDGFLLALGQTIGDLHRCGFFHGDLRWRNILTRLDQGKWQFCFIDNDRTRWFRWGIPFRSRVKNLSQMLFSGLLLDWPQNEWRVFLQGYLARCGLAPSLHARLINRAEVHAGRRLDERRGRDH